MRINWNMLKFMAIVTPIAAAVGVIVMFILTAIELTFRSLFGDIGGTVFLLLSGTVFLLWFCGVLEFGNRDM